MIITSLVTMQLMSRKGSKNVYRYKCKADALDMLNSSLFSTGDVVLVKDDVYIFTGREFQKLSTCENLSDSVSQPTDVQVSEQKCKSCGAPLMVSKHSKSAIVCEYCGSIYLQEKRL